MERPSKIPKDILPYVEWLEAKTKSPFYNSYVALKITTERWNKQLTEKEIDLFSIEDKPLFDMAHKYLTEQKPYLEQMDFLLGKMTPQEKEEAVKTVDGSTAEAHIFGKK